MKTEKQSAITPRRRYSPEVRRAMILDEAADIIAREGMAKLTLERISQSAGVSKSLIYKYFDNLLQLLQELLDRELHSQRRAQLKAAERAETFDELIRNITHAYLAYIAERGLIIERLQAEPSVTGMHDPTDYGRSGAVEYLAPIVARQFDMPLELARAATDISFGLPAAAGEYLLRSEMSLGEVEDLAVSMILGSITQFQADYRTRRRKLDR